MYVLENNVILRSLKSLTVLAVLKSLQCFRRRLRDKSMVEAGFESDYRPVKLARKFLTGVTLS